MGNKLLAPRSVTRMCSLTRMCSFPGTRQHGNTLYTSSCVLFIECVLLPECVLLLECDHSHRRSQEGEQILETLTPGGSSTNSGNGKERKSASSCTTLEKGAVLVHSFPPDAARNALFANSFGYFVCLCHELTVTLCLSSVCHIVEGCRNTPMHTPEVCHELTVTLCLSSVCLSHS